MLRHSRITSPVESVRRCVRRSAPEVFEVRLKFVKRSTDPQIYEVPAGTTSFWEIHAIYGQTSCKLAQRYVATTSISGLRL